MYGEVRFTAHRKSPPLLLPSEAILTGKDGTHVALIRKNGTVHFQTIDLGRDNGADTEITGGLTLGDTVIMNPTDEIREGAKVKAVE
jgi:multidrug efflux pump subunit AcrA (membrane-fusion protein)